MESRINRLNRPNARCWLWWWRGGRGPIPEPKGGVDPKVTFFIYFLVGGEACKGGR